MPMAKRQRKRRHGECQQMLNENSDKKNRMETSYSKTDDEFEKTRDEDIHMINPDCETQPSSQNLQIPSNDNHIDGNSLKEVQDDTCINAYEADTNETASFQSSEHFLSGQNIGNEGYCESSKSSPDNKKSEKRDGSELSKEQCLPNSFNKEYDDNDTQEDFPTVSLTDEPMRDDKTVERHHTVLCMPVPVCDDVSIRTDSIVEGLPVDDSKDLKSRRTSGTYDGSEQIDTLPSSPNSQTTMKTLILSQESVHWNISQYTKEIDTSMEYAAAALVNSSIVTNSNTSNKHCVSKPQCHNLPANDNFSLDVTTHNNETEKINNNSKNTSDNEMLVVSKSAVPDAATCPSGNVHQTMHCEKHTNDLRFETCEYSTSMTIPSSSVKGEDQGGKDPSSSVKGEDHGGKYPSSSVKGEDQDGKDPSSKDHGGKYPSSSVKGENQDRKDPSSSVKGDDQGGKDPLSSVKGEDRSGKDFITTFDNDIAGKYDVMLPLGENNVDNVVGKSNENMPVSKDERNSDPPAILNSGMPRSRIGNYDTGDNIDIFKSKCIDDTHVSTDEKKPELSTNLDLEAGLSGSCTDDYGDDTGDVDAMLRTISDSQFFPKYDSPPNDNGESSFTEKKCIDQRNKSLKVIDGRKEEGKKLVKTVLNELAVMNRQLLRLKREMNITKRNLTG